MSILEIAKIQVRRGKENQTGVPQLDSGEFGWAEDTENLYIGKRIVDGATDNNNTRVLTENDLNNIFSLIVGTGSAASTATYKYRESADYIESSISTVGKKLDNSVSLTDYGLVPSYTATDITMILQDAVANLFFNSSWDDWKREDAKRKLIIPAGNYYINDAVELPPYASLVGEGSGITTLILNVDNKSLFKTIDADGNDWDTVDMRSGIKRARQVHLEGMTLMYADSIQSSVPLVQLDNVLDASVKDVHFKTQFDLTSTTTYGLTTFGIGIGIRGTGGGLGSGDVNLCEHINIDRCVFDGLSIGVEATGTVINPIITQSIFSNLYNGIKFHTIDALQGPSNGVIVQNRFENIVNEGIYIGENPDNIRSNHLSENNFFIQVGNGLDLDDFTTVITTATAVIAFLSTGNKSINDYFHRRTVANLTTDPSFYYYPLVIGRTSVNDESATTATVYKTDIILNTGITPIAKVALNDHDQMATLRYQLYNETLSRKGTLVINLGPDGSASATDTFNYSFGTVQILNTVSIALPAQLDPISLLPNQFGVDVNEYPEFNESNLNPSENVWYLTGSDIYAGKTAQIISRDYVISDLFTTYNVFTTNAAPEFDFTVGTDTFALLKVSTTDIEFRVTDAVNNYVNVSCNNLSTTTDAIIEFQIDLLS